MYHLTGQEHFHIQLLGNREVRNEFALILLKVRHFAFSENDTPKEDAGDSNLEGIRKFLINCY